MILPPSARGSIGRLEYSFRRTRRADLDAHAGEEGCSLRVTSVPRSSRPSPVFPCGASAWESARSGRVIDEPRIVHWFLMRLLVVLHFERPQLLFRFILGFDHRIVRLLDGDD